MMQLKVPWLHPRRSCAGLDARGAVMRSLYGTHGSLWPRRIDAAALLRDCTVYGRRAAHSCAGATSSAQLRRQAACMVTSCTEVAATVATVLTACSAVRRMATPT